MAEYGRAVLDVAGLSHSRCKACFYLNDSPNNLANWERAADVVSAVHKFNEAFPLSKIEGCCHETLPLLVNITITVVIVIMIVDYYYYYIFSSPRPKT